MNSILETVCGVCSRVRDKTKQGTSFQNLLTTVRKEFKHQGLDVKFKSTRKKYLDQEEFYVNAYYDPEDDRNNDTPIEVIIYHNFDKAVVWDRQHITDLLREVFDAVVHEYKHQRQSRKRSYNTYWDHVDGNLHYHVYLTDPDEVDAYAFSIAVELCRSLGKFRALRYMPKFTTMSRIKMKDHYASPNLYAYVSHFGSFDDQLLKTLAKKVYIRIQKLDTDFIFV